MLVLINVARGGLASLALTFPLGWSIVNLGYAAGVLTGQVFGAAFGFDDVAVQSIAVLLTILAVLASSVMPWARYPRIEDELTAHADAAPSRGAAAATSVPSAEAEVPVEQADPIAVACEAISARHGVSEREAEVLELLARGNTRASIAEKLCISENTARVHVKNIYAKLHIHSKQQLIDMVDRRSA